MLPTLLSVPSIPVFIDALADDLWSDFLVSQCEQYPDRACVLIGSSKVDCEANIAAYSKRNPVEEGKRADTETSIDAGWIVEYSGGGNLRV